MTPAANAFTAYAEKAIPRVVRKRQERKEKRLNIDPKSGGILIPSDAEQKIEEGQRLQAAYRKWRTAEKRAAREQEPRLKAFERGIKRCGAEDGDVMLSACRADWLLAAPQNVRIEALRSIARQCDRINLALGGETLDDPMPPETSIYFEARALLHGGGRL